MHMTFYVAFNHFVVQALFYESYIKNRNHFSFITLQNSPWHSAIVEAFAEGNLYFL